MGRALRHRLEPRQKIGRGLKDGRTHRVWEKVKRCYLGSGEASGGQTTEMSHPEDTEV